MSTNILGISHIIARKFLVIPPGKKEFEWMFLFMIWTFFHLPNRLLLGLNLRESPVDTQRGVYSACLLQSPASGLREGLLSSDWKLAGV